jgi:hypothetical protein
MRQDQDLSLVKIEKPAKLRWARALPSKMRKF